MLSPRSTTLSLWSCAALAVVLLSSFTVQAILPRPGLVRLGNGLSRKLQRPFSSVATHSLRKDLLAQCKLQLRNASLDHFSRVRSITIREEARPSG